VNKPWDVVIELENDNSRLVKEAIIKRESTAGNDELFKGFRAAYDAMVTFGVKKVDEKIGDGNGITSDEFWAVADKLEKRELTGNAAQAAIAALRDAAKELQWNRWYRRILIKDMRCGTSDSTINKHADEKYHVPVFTCQLAHDGLKHESKISGEKLIEVKLDGVRVLSVLYPDGTVKQFSRNGKELVNFPEVCSQLCVGTHAFTEPMVLDGEIMSSSFQDLMKQISRKSDVKTDDAVLNLFDIVPLRDFLAGKCNQSQVVRSAKLKQWHHEISEHTPNINVLGQQLVDLDTLTGKQTFAKINADAIKGGYEGIMIKDLDAPYECKRSVAWLKQKPYIEVSLTVQYVEEGTGRNVGRLGAFFCTGLDDGKLIEVNVGSGFSDDQRIEFWLYQEECVGRVVEVRADAITQNQDGTYSLRFPRFLRFRGFVPGEKI
jgi:DNA ligase 1